MSEDKKVHRLEPGKTPKTFESSKHSPIQPTQPEKVVFQKLEIEEENFENQWDEGSVESTKERGITWVPILVGVFGVLLVGSLCWGLGLLSSSPESEDTLVLKASKKQLSMVELFEKRKEAVRRYALAETVEERAQFVRDGQRLYPLMKEHYERFPMKEVWDVKVKGEHPKQVGETMFWNMHVDLNGKRVTMIVENLESGEAKVDWEVDAPHQPDEFSAFLQTKPSDPKTFRALIRGAQKNGFHGFEFDDYNKYRCFLVSIPNYDDYVWAYTEIGTQLDQLWVNFVTDGRRRDFDKTRDRAVILQLRFPQDAQSKRCVHLGELVTPGWIAKQAE